MEVGLEFADKATHVSPHLHDWRKMRNISHYFHNVEPMQQGVNHELFY